MSDEEREKQEREKQEREGRIKETAQAVALALKEAGITNIDPKFNPGDKPGEGDGDTTVVITEAPEDKIYNDPRGGFRSLSEFACAVANHGAKFYGQNHIEKLRDWKHAVAAVTSKTAGIMEEGDMSQGGYLVPEEFRADLMRTPLEGAIVRPRALKIPMATNRIGIPAVVDASHATTFFGGIAPTRTGEGDQKTKTKPELGKVTLTLHKLTGLVYVTDELLEDSPISLAPILNQMFGSAIMFEEDDDYLMGTGVGRPIGAFNAANPSLIAQAIEAGQAANTIVWQNIVNMWSRVHPSCMRNVVWVANNECFPQLATMAMAVGTGGVPVWMPANGAADTPFGTLMGRPLLLSEKMQGLGTQGDIGLADFTQYLIGEKQGGGLKAATSIHLRFDYDETVFRWVLRYDGQPWWLSALTPKRGTATLSPFVVLAVRA